MQPSTLLTSTKQLPTSTKPLPTSTKQLPTSTKPLPTSTTKLPTSTKPLHLDLKGSATSEFVLIALPLFLPALLFFLAMSQVTKSEMETSFIAREAVRAFTTGNDDEEAHLRVQSLLAAYEKPDLSYSVVCSSQPCISPGAGVQITIFRKINLSDSSQQLNSSERNFWGDGLNTTLRNRHSLATATGYVDKWQ